MVQDRSTSARLIAQAILRLTPAAGVAGAMQDLSQLRGNNSATDLAKTTAKLFESDTDERRFVEMGDHGENASELLILLLTLHESDMRAAALRGPEDVTKCLNEHAFSRRSRLANAAQHAYFDDLTKRAGVVTCAWVQGTAADGRTSLAALSHLLTSQKDMLTRQDQLQDLLTQMEQVLRQLGNNPNAGAPLLRRLAVRTMAAFDGLRTIMSANLNSYTYPTHVVLSFREDLAAVRQLLIEGESDENRTVLIPDRPYAAELNNAFKGSALEASHLESGPLLEYMKVHILWGLIRVLGICRDYYRTRDQTLFEELQRSIGTMSEYEEKAWKYIFDPPD